MKAEKPKQGGKGILEKLMEDEELEKKEIHDFKEFLRHELYRIADVQQADMKEVLDVQKTEF